MSETKSCLYCGSADNHLDLDGTARVVVCDNCWTRVPISIWEDPDPVHAAAPALYEALEHIAEYWNRSENERAMADALWHIIETAEKALALADGKEAS